jgi:carnosine synthase
LLEEYLDGPEVDVDILLFEGRCVYAAVSDNGPTVEPYFTETYGVLPSMLPEASQHALIDLSLESLQAIGFRTGLFHMEAKLTSRGPRLIEVNARLGGGPICEMHKRVASIDLAVEQLRLVTGLGPSETAFRATSRRSFAYMTTNAVSSGVVGKNMAFLSSFEQLETVKRLTCRVQPGDRIVGPAEGQPSWLVELWMESDNAADALRLVDEIQEVSDQIAHAFATHYIA